MAAEPPGGTGSSGRRMKSAAAFRTISEVARELDVPQHVLRFWESRFTQVSPLKRGGGRRYYRPEDVDLLRRIRELLYVEGYTIKGVQKLLRDGRGRLQPSTERAADGEGRSAPADAGLDAIARAEIRAVLDELQALRERRRRA